MNKKIEDIWQNKLYNLKKYGIKVEKKNNLYILTIPKNLYTWLTGSPGKYNVSIIDEWEELVFQIVPNKLMLSDKLVKEIKPQLNTDGTVYISYQYDGGVWYIEGNSLLLSKRGEIFE